MYGMVHSVSAYACIKCKNRLSLKEVKDPETNEKFFVLYCGHASCDNKLEYKLPIVALELWKDPEDSEKQVEGLYKDDDFIGIDTP